MEMPAFISGNPKLGGSKKINKQIRKAYKGSVELERKILKNFNNLGNITKSFNKAAEKNAPIAGQIEDMADAYSSIENPAVRSQLIRSGENALRANRANERSQALSLGLQSLQGKMGVLNNRQVRLQTLLGERQFSRSMAGQNYNDAAQRRNALQSMIQQKAEGLEFFGDAPGQYFLKTGQTSPAVSSPWSTVTGPNDQLYTINKQTGDIVAPNDPNTGEPIVEEGLEEKLSKIGKDRF